jgi:hypothetical protein
MRTSRRPRLLTLASALACVLAACAADAMDGQRNDGADALTCMPGTLRACPCAGAATSTAMGMQSCDTTGTSYGACAGCPAPQAPAQPGAGTGGSAAGAGSGGTAGAAGSAGAAGGSSGAGGEAGAGLGPSLDMAGAMPGTSCGVGLPALCALETEKCCARSLDVDTCIPAGETCACSTAAGCTVMEAFCDGPEDCPDGQVCCGTLAQNGAGYESFACTAQCSSQQTQREACHAEETQCPGGYVCANSQLLTNVQVCIDPASIEQ